MVEKLSEAYKKVDWDTFAYCPNCGKVYIDDIPRWGSLYCPNPDCRHMGWCLERGLIKDPRK